MDLLSAFSGLERIAIIGGAMLVGYWGFRLLATDRTPALVFMGIACAVLFGALFTGSSHVKNMGESYQLATAPRAGQVELVPSPEDVIDNPDSPITPPDHDIAANSVGDIPSAQEEEPGEELQPAPAPIAAEVEADVDPEATEPVPEPADLLSSQELGGRIVSVKSESVTLEWTPRPAAPR